MISGEVPVLIPAYRPRGSLVSIVGGLLELGVPGLIVVDDGSGPEFRELFEQISQDPRVHLIPHAVNLGKGAALKTGLNYALVHFAGCCGVVTADADGQHRPEDVVRIVQRLQASPDALVLGVRAFGRDVPFRSRMGNSTTSLLMRLVVGKNLTDTQTGLRGIPAGLIPHLLRFQSSGYEFELDMLIACKHLSRRIVEEPIQTIYLDGNRSSHFRPILDSMRIYFLLFRFSILSVLTAVLDNIVFIWALSLTGSIAQSQVAARFMATIFSYVGARRAVFHSQQRHPIVFPKYALLVLCNGLVSYLLIEFLHFRIGVRTIPAKLSAEGFLFFANFVIQRDFVFTRRQPAGTATDWDHYYQNVPASAKLTRRYTTSVLLDAIQRYAAPEGEAGLSIVEIGGANSCFLDRILAEVNPASYDVIDTNQYGLSLLANRVGESNIVRLHNQSVLGLAFDRPADIVFSIGLVEHFDRASTREAVLAHFDALREGGVAIITFPTPTLLYRAARRLIETVGMWKFHDERPLDRSEVIAAVRERGDIVYEKMLWPLILTQYAVVAKKRTSTDFNDTSRRRTDQRPGLSPA